MKKQFVYEILTYIPTGQVATYGQLSTWSGINSPRAIGQILHQNPDPLYFPCHRVVFADGKLSDNYAFGGASSQKQKLLSEGVQFINNQVVESFWQPSPALHLYFELHRKYGDPGPWPWFDTDAPHSAEEIAIGSILTQNTNWKNVQQVIEALRQYHQCSLQAIIDLEPDVLKSIIRPARYQNQKCQYLNNFSSHILNKYKSLNQFFTKATDPRTELLSVKGIGPETADTILLYSGNYPTFVIDAYTKKFAAKFNLSFEPKYTDLQKYFEDNLPSNVLLYQKYHALIIKEGQ